MTSRSFTPIALRLSAMCAFMGYLTYRHSNEPALLFVVFFYLIAMFVWAGIYAVRSRTDSVQSSQPSLTTSLLTRTMIVTWRRFVKAMGST